MRPTVAAIQRFSISKAHETQLRLSQKIIKENVLPQKINIIAGVDVAYAGELAIGAVAVLDYESLELLESRIATFEVKFPYIPTLLSFREIPPTVACIKKLKLQPDVLLADGQGIAHPYGCGLASHLGLAIGKPTIGVAKSRLIGEPATIAGQVFLLQNGQIIGAVVNIKDGVKPIYVSVGHMTSLETALKITKHCLRNSKLPEPILQAHKTATEKRKNVQAKHITL